MSPIYSTAAVKRRENAVDTDRGNRSYQFLRNTQITPFLLLFWVGDIYFSYSSLFLRRCWKSRMNADVWKGFCFSLSLILYASVKFTCLTERRSKGLAPAEGALTSIHSTVAGNFVASFWLLLSASQVLLLLVNICYTFAPQQCGRFQHLHYLWPPYKEPVAVAQ